MTPDPIASDPKSSHSRMTLTPATKSVVIKMGPSAGHPWWWREIQADPGLCSLDVRYVEFRNKRSSKDITLAELPLFALTMLPVYLQLRRDYDYMFTFECSLTTFAFSFWQTLLWTRQPKHVVLQFIMREKTRAFRSRLKYLLMKWCFSSIHMAICSSSEEAAYYRSAFGWSTTKAVFVPYHTSGEFTSTDTRSDEGFILAAGRVFRDFRTLIEAVRATDYPSVIVAPRHLVSLPREAVNIQVLEEIPFDRFSDLLLRCRVVVVPLHKMKISAGQVVMLHAMALGKPVIASRTAGTADYIIHGKNGLLVEANNPKALTLAIDQLMSNATLRAQLGHAARQTVMARHLPHHYTQMVRRRLADAAARVPTPQ